MVYHQRIFASRDVERFDIIQGLIININESCLCDMSLCKTFLRKTLLQNHVKYVYAHEHLINAPLRIASDELICFAVFQSHIESI